MMMQYLADFMISGEWLSGFVVLVIGAIGAVYVKARKDGVRVGEGSSSVTLRKPVPTLTTREEPAWATRPDLEEHIERTERHFTKIWERFESDRHVARESANNIHKRLDKQSEATAGVLASLTEVKETTGKLLDLALNRKPPTR